MKVGALCIKKGVPILTHPLFIYSAIVGVRRFELPTTRPPDAYSNRAELHPALFYGCKGKYFSLYSKAFTIKIQGFENFLLAHLLIYLNITHLRKQGEVDDTRFIFLIVHHQLV